MIKIMNKVIRTARISDHTVILPIQVNPKMVDLPEVLDEETIGDSEQVEMVGDVVNEESEPEIDIEAIVAERLQEAEVRFLAEKEQAVQASYDEGQARGLEEGQARGLEEGQARGLEEGQARGLEEGQAQSHDEIVRFQSMLSALAGRWGDVFKTADQDLVELAMAIAHNLVGGLVDKYEDLVLGAVRDCMTHLQDRSRVVIRVHPDDLGIVREHREEWQQAFERIESLVVEADETIGRGGCLVETPSGDIDAQIESRLAKLQGALMEAVQNAPAEQPPVYDKTDVDSASSETQNINDVDDDQTLDENNSANSTGLNESEVLTEEEQPDEAADLQITDEVVERDTTEEVVDSDDITEGVETEMLDEDVDVIDADEGAEVEDDDGGVGLMDSDRGDENQNVNTSLESDDLDESGEHNDAAGESAQHEDLMVMDDDADVEEDMSHTDREDDANGAESEEGSNSV